ncbi:hypothetical protein [Candidatus Poriferisocius sp.]|uniref:hypothetical protein n=1 Tax=Candidatus Poriferisocius sp. TaxID=3101276 RepID=UPI003B515827
METATQARRGDIDIALIAVAHDASLRCSQILAHEWGDVDAPQHDGLGQIHVPHPTAAQPATAPISEFTDQNPARIRPPTPTPANASPTSRPTPPPAAPDLRPPGIGVNAPVAVWGSARCRVGRRSSRAIAGCRYRAGSGRR